jgi:hypothetical protein
MSPWSLSDLAQVKREEGKKSGEKTQDETIETIQDEKTQDGKTQDESG